MSWQRRYEVSSHENFDHDRIKSVGYDWDFAADPNIAPRRPLRVYLPQTTEEVATVVKEIKSLKLELRIRSKGHSSNNLVLGDRNTAVLWTEFLREPAGEDGKDERVGTVDPHTSSVWIFAGAILAKVDEQLEKQGFGLPVIGDHNHITAGGFVSVGGVSPASNVHGMFVDNVEELEWVDLESGEVRRCTPTDKPSDFFRLVGGTGRHGVITRLRCRVISITKTREILENKRNIVHELGAFVELSARRIKNPEGAIMERGLWLDFPIFRGFTLRVGQYSGYQPTDPTWLKSLRNRVIHGFLHGVGYVAGRLGGVLDRIIQAIGIAGVIVSPRYASIKNIESFADKVLDSSVGDPARMLIVFAPVEIYTEMFKALHDLCIEFRARGCVTYILLYVKGIKSEFLSRALARKNAACCEILLYLGLVPEKMTKEMLDELVGRIDALCKKKGALRYMHTRTVDPDDPIRASIDPNAQVMANLPK